MANNWFLLATQVAFTTDTFDTTEAKFISDIVADYKVRISKLEGAMSNVLGSPELARWEVLPVP